MPAGSSTNDPTPERPVLVGLGGSAGSISALQTFFDHLPDRPGEAFVVVVHLPSDRKSLLSEILGNHTGMTVESVVEAVEIEPNHVYVAPPDRALVVEGRTLRPVAFDRSDDRQAPIDQFFRSLAQFGAATVGVVLSGASSDGSVGLRAIEEAGGLVAAQDPNEAEYDLMPRSAVQMSRVDLVLPVAELAERIHEHTDVVTRVADVYETAESEQDVDQSAVLQDIFEQVRTRTGHDFSEYKQSTMRRRIQRRMQVNQITALEEYLQFLRDHPEEVRSLQRDLLISVTSFFRDPESFEALREQVIPELFEGKGAEDDLRVWVVGTATGEEAYSLAILLLEHARSLTPRPETIQIFATDIDEAALGYARSGHYPAPIAANVPEEYLERYFKKEGAQYVIKEHVRNHVLFTPHNLLKDPPFSKLDLISCRNLLIYLRRDLQESVFDLFSYALKENGYLFLGNSESAERAEQDFQTISQTHRIYRVRNRNKTAPNLPTMPLTPTPSRFKTTIEQFEPTSSEASVHQRLLADYSPPSVVVNENHRLLHLSDDAGRYLKHPSGTPRTNIVELVRPELQTNIRSVLHEAFSEDRTARSRPIEVALNGTSEVVRLVAHPGAHRNRTEKTALLLFEAVDEDDAPPRLHDTAPDDADTSTEERLRTELEQTKEELRATVEEYESSQQKLQAANEELRSMNEEYKSMTEELETSKEELQSVNEELKTVNQELEEKVEELRQANSDLKNVMASTQIGTLFLDRELRIQRYTPRIEDLFNIRPEDEGRPIGDLTHHLNYDALEADAQSVLDDLQPIEREVQTDDGTWFLARVHPYRTVDDKIDGVVLVFIDITDRREAQKSVRQQQEFRRLAVEAGDVGLWALNVESGDCYLSSKAVDLLGLSSAPSDGLDGLWQQVVPPERWVEQVHPNDRSRVEENLAIAAEQEEQLEIEYRVRPEDGAVRWLYSRGSVKRTEDGTLRIHGATLDITERREAEEALRRSVEFHRLAAEAGQVGTWDLNLDTGDFYISSKTAEIAGFESEESRVVEGHWQHVVSRDAWRSHIHPDDRERVQEALLTSRKDGVRFDEEFRVCPSDHEERWLRAVGEVVRAEDDTTHVHGATIDVTEEKETKAELRALNDRLEEQTAQVESLSEALASAEEKVRTRISRMLHDDVQQTLFAAVLKLETFLERVSLSDDARDTVRHAKELLKEGIEATRTLSSELNPPIEDKSLREALSWLTDQMEDSYGLSVKMWAKGRPGPVDAAIRTLLFHVARELLFNVVKHAGVDEASLLLAEGDDRIRVVVEDEGAGFEPGELETRTDGTGLTNLKHRIGLIGGHVAVDAAPDEGTRITLEVPRETGTLEATLP